MDTFIHRPFTHSEGILLAQFHPQSEPALEGIITNKALWPRPLCLGTLSTCERLPLRLLNILETISLPPAGVATFHPYYLRCVPVRGFSQRLELFSPLDWLSFETIQEKEESHEGNGCLKCALIRALRSTSP